MEVAAVNCVPIAYNCFVKVIILENKVRIVFSIFTQKKRETAFNGRKKRSYGKEKFTTCFKKINNVPNM